MNEYRKLKIPVGFVSSTDVFSEGTPITVRTLEGDADAIVSDEIYIMVGILGEAYPINCVFELATGIYPAGDSDRYKFYSYRFPPKTV
jgi:hypothetical protein